MPEPHVFEHGFHVDQSVHASHFGCGEENVELKKIQIEKNLIFKKLKN